MHRYHRRHFLPGILGRISNLLAGALDLVSTFSVLAAYLKFDNGMKLRSCTANVRARVCMPRRVEQTDKAIKGRVKFEETFVKFSTARPAEVRFLRPSIIDL